MIETSPLIILFAAMLTNNMLLSNFLGMCSFIVISKDVPTAFGLGQAVTFVMTLTTAINYLLYYHVLVPLGLEYIKYIVFIMTIAAFVQLVEMYIKRYFKSLFASLGIFLPLITVNCAILGASLFMVIREYGFIQSILFGLGSGIGWMMALVIMSSINVKLEEAPIPKYLKGHGMTFIVTGIMALAFMGFSGLVVI